MGQACSKPEPDTKNEIIKNSAQQNQNNVLPQAPYDSDARFYQTPAYDPTEDRKNQIFESRYIEKPQAGRNRNNVIPEETINSYHQFDNRSSNYDRNGGNKLDFLDMKDDGNYNKKLNSSYNSQNQSAIKTKANFYEDEFQDQGAQNMNRSISQNRYDDYYANGSRHNRIFDNERRYQQTKSPYKSEANSKSGVKLNNNQKSSNIFMAEPENQTVKFDSFDPRSERNSNNVDVKPINNKPSNNSTFKDFLANTNQDNKMSTSRYSTVKSPTPNRQDKSFDKVENRSNVRVSIKSEFGMQKSPNSEALYNQNRGSMNNNGYEAYGYKSQTDLKIAHFQNQNTDYSNPQHKSSINHQTTHKSSEFMKLSEYKDTHSYNGIYESNFDRLPSVNDNRGIRESNINELPDFNPRRTIDSNNKRNLSTIKEESQLDHEDKHPVRLNNGNMYLGELRDNQQHGKGKEIFVNGDVYTGDFLEGKRHGEGTFEKKDDFIYVGGFKNNKFEGKGKKVFVNGNTFEGLFKNGKEEGTGILRDAEGKIIHHGIWIDGEFTKL